MGCANVPQRVRQRTPGGAPTYTIHGADVDRCDQRATDSATRDQSTKHRRSYGIPSIIDCNGDAQAAHRSDVCQRLSAPAAVGSIGRAEWSTATCLVVSTQAASFHGHWATGRDKCR
ncbi:hypothetical protein LSAT2_005739 [Lamellibrachia satsuma]|nr:hypothetical protein LSAT2_005739 [Lamellibrachia satsuma]